MIYLKLATIALCAGSVSGCATQRLLPVEAPDNGSIVRLSRIQGDVGLPMANGFADTCQAVVVGELTGCVQIERDGCKLNTCGEVE